METPKVYEEIINFIAAGTTPESVIAFRPSEAIGCGFAFQEGKRRCLRRTLPAFYLAARDPLRCKQKILRSLLMFHSIYWL